MSDATAPAAPASVTPRELAAARPAATIDAGVAVALLFFLSGGASLLLEVAAVRACLELFGSTAASLGAVGGAFLGCLALGALVVGSRADRAERPLRAYALLEVVACAGGLLALFVLLPRLDGLATSLAEAELRGESRLVTRWLACTALLAIPVGALGATLPFAARVRAATRSRGAAAGGLQVASTLGAMTGALLGSTVLLGALGTSGTWMAAAAANGLAALGAWLLVRSAGEPAARAEQAAPPAEATGAGSARIPVAPLAIASFLAGACVLSLEVLLFRGLGQVTRGSQDTLGALLAAFLGASALGSAVGVAFARDPRRARTGFVAGQVLSLLAPLVALLWLRAMAREEDLGWLRFGVGATTWQARIGWELLGALLVAGPAAFATAIAFPCACELGRDARFGRLVAWLSGSWTLGAAIAGVATPALAIPQLGLRNALLGSALLPIVALALVAAADRSLLAAPRRLALAVGGAAAGALLLLLPIGGASTLADPLLFFRHVAGAQGGVPLAYFEGPSANVAVVERRGGERVLAVNDQLALGGSGANLVEAIQGVLPALLHPQPGRALHLGVGTGVTTAALRQIGCKEVDAVELLPPVLRMLPLFARENSALFLDPAVRFHATDARAFVRAAEPETYDVIVGDLFFPWEAEAGLLYTREHFERVKRLLAPGGIFCQWLPGHQLRWEELGLVGRTFSAVFEGATLWLARADFPFPVLGLVASTERLELDVPELAARLEQHPSRAFLEKLGAATATDFLALYVADEWFFREQFQEKETLVTADRARVEFSAARRIETDEVVALHNRLRLFETHEDVVYRMTTQTSLDKKALAQLKRELSAAAQLMWRLFDAQTTLMLAAANRQLPPAARRNSPEELETQAFQTVGGLLRDRPDHGPALDLMVAMLADQLRLRAYHLVVQGVTALEQQAAVVRPRLRYLRALAFLHAWCDPDPQSAAQFTKPLEFAVADLRKALELDPELLEASVHLGLALFFTGTKEAREEALALLRATREEIVAPERPDGHGLPAPAEAVLAFLESRDGDVASWLARPESQPWARCLDEAMKRAPR